MKLGLLLDELTGYELNGDAKAEVTGLAFDSRQVKPGYLFVAVSGWADDGHRYIGHAVARGAVVVVGERPHAEVEVGEVAYVRVPASREALARMAAAWYGHPGRKMTVVGVTGTDGKTTTVNLIQSILAAAGWRTGMVSTVNALVGDRYQDTGLHVTTPDPLTVQSLLAEMARAGTDVAVLEATSFGLAQHRVTGAEFDVAVVTNVTHEHLDQHGTWEAYCEAKARLFRMLAVAWHKPGVPKVAVINVDDASYPVLQPIPTDVQVRYGLEGDADVTADDAVIEDGEARYTVRSPWGAFEVRTTLVERYNVYNVLAAASATLALGAPIEAVQAGVGAVRGVVGRMERVDEGQDFAAYVDFAHTPNALRAALEALRRTTSGRLIVVFGSAGQRDVYKRAMMGEVAGRLADVTVITAEDPRTEDLDAIIAEIARGCEAAGAIEGRGYYRVPDRAEAIAHAVGLARAGDTVIATGKGHERSMCFGTVEHPWSDRQALRAALLERLGRPGEVLAPRLPTSMRTVGAG